MIRFIHKLTGTEMQVADSRKEEYLAAGHKLAAEPAPVKPEPSAEPAPDKPTAAPKTAAKAAVKKNTGRAKK